jgi:coproporphyrinogen III oxidase-like Fe-S oxidoreductase
MTLDYQQPLWRPPSEGENLIIQATYGCSFNQCSFCAMYRSKPYQARPVVEVMNDIEMAARDWPEASRIFLADGDALALPTDHLIILLDKLAERFPQLTRVSCYATPSNILRKRNDELDKLRRHKLTLLYVGIESGADRLLRKVTKGATQRTIAEALCKAREAGLKVSGTVILGLGGTTHWQEHIDDTVVLLNKAPLNQLSTLQLYLDESIEAEFRQRYGEPFVMPDDQAILREQQRLIAGLNPPQPLIFRSNHASNALALAGNLPRDRERLLAEITQALNGERRLRPHHLRSM